METVLDSGSTWFLEFYTQRGKGQLSIRVVEGIATPTRQFADLAGVHVGPYTGLAIRPESRCVEIVFQGVLGCFVLNENYDSTDPERRFPEKQTYIRQLGGSSLRAYAAVATGITRAWHGEPLEFHVWTEDQIFQVFCEEPPTVTEVSGPPDFSIERGETWSAA